MNPDATQADMGERMQAYYDADNKVWVFPGEDPAEVAQPIGPPPTTPMALSSGPASVASFNDPLAAMMAPPQRAPSSRLRASGVRPSPSSMPMLFPPGMMPMTPNAAPKFAVFAPKPDDDCKKENEKPAGE